MATDVNPAGYIETVPVRPHTDQQSRDAAAEEMRAEMARRKVGMNELARRIGKDPKWVQNRANGRTSITVEDIPLLAAGLGMSPQDLGHALVDQLPVIEL
ncbi:helix-turn-helix DNA binding protein [Gordonia phage Angelique]|nr:helix-turn-helix DNA binding protein [Gordonia phage Angelique]